MLLLLVTVNILLTWRSFSGVVGAQVENCPPWMASEDGQCTCRDLSGFDRALLFCDCKTHKTYIAAGMCISLEHHNSSHSEAVVGDCPYIPAKKKFYAFKYYKELPDNESLLNDVMCGPFNRQGLLCSSCRPGYGISVYSFGRPCAKCDSNHLGVLWYVLLEILPISVLYVIVVLFSIRATSAPLAGFVFLTHTFAIRRRIPLYASLKYSTNQFTYILLQVVLTLCGIWNLEFFSFLLPPFCISEKISNIHAVFLEYVSALYPLILVFISFVGIELHAHNVQPVVWLWKPFHKWFVRFRKTITWDIKRSVIDAFSTFLLLSYSKIMFVSFKLLHVTTVNSINGTVMSKSLEFAPNMEYFGPKHLPFALIAITLITVFNVLPILLLALYPTRLFQKSLRCCRCRATQAVHMFVDTYQGCFKDGTNSTRDYRALSVVYLLLRFAVLSIYVHHTELVDNGLTLIAFGIIYMLLSLLLAVFKPYKADHVTYCESAILFLLGVIGVFTYIWLFTSTKALMATIMLMALALPHFVLMGYVTYKISCGKLVIQWVKKRAIHYVGMCVEYFRTLNHPSTTPLHEDIEESLPDRFVNPDEYFHSVSYQLEDVAN